MKRSLLVSIVISLFLLIGTGVGFYCLHDYYNGNEVEATSSLGKKVKTPTESNESTDLKSIIHETQKSVVQIEAQLKDDATSSGSGFLYNTTGDVITNAHVVDGAEKITVKTSDAKQFEAQIIGMGDTTDIAVIRVPGLKETKPLAVAEERMAEVGDEIIALGSPLGLQNTVTTGIISGLDREFILEPYRYEHIYQISAPITNGNSGGPLIDADTGEAIAINSAGTDSGAIGFSIPLPNVIDEIKGWSEEPVEITVDSEGHEVVVTPQGLTGEDYKDNAAYLIGYFYESLSTQDYVTAYSLLGSRWQSEMSYEDFRSGYIHTVHVEVSNTTGSLNQTNDEVKVTATIKAEERTEDQKTTTALYNVTYQVGYENDHLKILSGKAQKLK
ncbi:trypsin-like peptidase domain-containing protein [Alkalihalobacillus macyae]|uniref:S1C family serine protease n=1 Tax=Guptibacillus hwajinpoensis TaxID=208199 RepID=UPI00273BF5F3|nr:trypsin-like peptidase domain-containing protein [Alkalihalobacillus macyae]MDP4549269.1 trypsin-like peptidase domain-containing protein [Alkalihalobacillus macyae]